MRPHSLSSLCLIVSLLLLCPARQAFSQDAEQVQEENRDPGVVRLVRFTGNETVSGNTLKTLVRTRTNREFLGIRKFTPWYFLWKMFGVGESPSLLDRDLVANDIERVRLYYENLGFFEAGVDTTVIEYRPNRYEVSFLIEEGPRSSIQSVSFTGIPEFDNPDVKEDFFSESLYSGTMADDSTFRVREAYSLQKLRDEQTRIINFFKNHGYAATQRDSVRALIKPDENDSTQLDVLYTIRTGNIYNFGNVHVTLSGPENQKTYDDSLRLEGEPHTQPGFTIQLEKEHSAQTRFSLLTEQIQFQPGAVFDQSAYLRSVNAYQNLGNMSINRFGLSEESSLPDYSRSEIPVYFDLKTLPRHSIRTEFFGMRRYGFGTGAGINYNNNNLFGRSDNFTAGINGHIEFVTSSARSEGATTFRSFEARAEYSVPRLNFPFGSFNNASWFESARTLYSLTYSQSDQEFFDINSDIRANLRYEINHSQQMRSFLDLFELDVIDTNPASNFRQTLLDQFRDYDDVTGEPLETDEEVERKFEVQRILADFDPQFSSILRYSLRFQNTNMIKRNYGYFSEFSVAAGGNIPHLLDRFVVSPDELEGELPSPLGISSNALSYSRFVKLTADYRRYLPLSQSSVFAFRIFGGLAQPYGQSETIPLNRRFFAGGSNDIRGWGPFRLGPGEIAEDEVNVPGGEIKIAAFGELRQIFLQNVLGSQWHIAWHTDAGNVWYRPGNKIIDENGNDILRDGRFAFDKFYNQIAVSSGLGLRLDWEFIVARLDFSFRVHDLEEGWFNNRQAYFSFGIGHSF